MAYLVWCNVKVAPISPGYGTYLNLEEKMITRAPIVDEKSNLKMNEESLDRVYLDYQCDTFKINNASLYQILLKVIISMDAFVYMKQRKSIQNG